MKLLISTAVAALLATSAFADTVRLGTEGAYPPYNFINDAGELDGYERDVGDELCRRAELTCEWVTNDWDSIIPNLLSGNYDAIMAGMNIVPERQEIIDFTQNYFPPAASAYIAMSDDVDLTGGVIAAQVATVQSSYVASSGATLMEFATGEETVSAIRNGEADATFADKDFLAPTVDASGGEIIFVGEDVLIGDGIAVGLRKSDAELREKFNVAIQSMKDDGTLNELLAKWFDGENAPQY